MRVLRVVVFVFTMLVIITFTGCDLGFDAVDNLIRAPKLTGRYAAIESAFEASVGTNIKLKSPHSGAYKTAYVIYDYDADLVEEAMVFYTSATDEMTVRIHFLDYINGKWVASTDEAGKDSEINEIQFRDLDGDQAPEIIITYNTKKSNKIMSIYKVKNENKNALSTVVSMATVQYSHYMCLDMNADGCTEILYTAYESTSDSTSIVPYVRILGKEENDDELQYAIIASFALDSEIATFQSLCSDTLKDQTRVYIDCLYDDVSTYVTQVVTWNPETGYYLYVNNDTLNNSYVTNRIGSVFSADIDSDGIVEIPSESEVPLAEVLNAPADTVVKLLIRQYFRCDADAALDEVYAFFIDPLGAYNLDLKRLELQDRVSVAYEFNNRTAHFYEYRYADEQRGEKLFSVRVESTASGGLACYCDVTEYGESQGLLSDDILTSIRLSISETEVIANETDSGRGR